LARDILDLVVLVAIRDRRVLKGLPDLPDLLAPGVSLALRVLQELWGLLERLDLTVRGVLPATGVPLEGVALPLKQLALPIVKVLVGGGDFPPQTADRGIVCNTSRSGQDGSTDQCAFRATSLGEDIY